MDLRDTVMRGLVGETQLPVASCFSTVQAEGISWPIGRVRPYGAGFVMEPEERRNSLPIEFWNHELLDADFHRDEDALMAFMTQWGIPYHPMRNSPYLDVHLMRELGIVETDKEAKAFLPKPRPGEVDAVGVFRPSRTSPAIPYASRKEVTGALRYLQFFVGKTIYGVGGFADHIAFETINHAACNPLALRMPEDGCAIYFDTSGRSLRTKGLLTSAICNQIIDSFSDEASWRRCACEGCFRVFKRRRPGKEGVRPDSDSKYCCLTCKNRQAKRNQREAARNRIRH